MSRLAQVGRDSLIYGVGGVLARAVGLLLLPVYTRIFPPESFGTIEMLLTTSNLLGALMVMGMDSAQSFYFFEQKAKGTEAQADVVSAILQWRLLWGAICLVLATLGAPLLNAWLFGGKLQLLHFVYAFVSAFCMQLMMQAAELFRLLYRPWSYVIVTAAYGLLTGVCVVVCVLVFRLDILGFFLGAMIAGAVLAAVAWWMARGYLRLECSRQAWWPRIIRFGWPLLPAALAYYVMSVADRWFIQYYSGAFELGLYAVAAKLGFGMILIVETFRKAWWPIAMDAMHSDDGPDTFRMIARLYVGLGAIGVLAVAFLAPILMRWFAAPAYFPAYPLIGIMGWQALLYGMYLIVSAGIWKSERTKLSAWLMAGGALINVLLCLCLVPPWGGLGASLATAVTYLLWIVATYVVAERFWPVHLPVSVLGAIALIAVSAHAALVWAQGRSYWMLAALFVVAATLLIGYLALEAGTRSKVMKRVGLGAAE